MRGPQRTGLGNHGPSLPRLVEVRSGETENSTDTFRALD
jgi:hypothetical protein